MVDDDLLEFLVRVADNPAEWNKIRRVLSKYYNLYNYIVMFTIVKKCYYILKNVNVIYYIINTT